MEISRTIWKFQWPYGNSKDHMEIPRTIWKFQGPYGNSNDHMEIPSSDHMEIPRTIWKFQGPYGKTVQRLFARLLCCSTQYRQQTKILVPTLSQLVQSTLPRPINAPRVSAKLIYPNRNGTVQYLAVSTQTLGPFHSGGSESLYLYEFSYYHVTCTAFGVTKSVLCFSS